MDNNFKSTFIAILITSIIVSSIAGGIMGFWAANLSGSDNIISRYFLGQPNNEQTQELGAVKVIKIEEESAVVAAVEKVSPAVVSIIVTKDLPILERYYIDPFEGDDFFGDFFNFGIPQYRQNGTEKREVGGGTGFIVSADGYIVTNKHVVLDEEAEYTVLMNDESKHSAQVLARDSFTDLAVLKIDPSTSSGQVGNNLPIVELGDSDTLKVGQTVIAIGNALGEFRNTVSTGVISGLARNITAGGVGIGSEQLTNVIQTDASINPGNSGGPLLNLAGQVIGINVAMAQAENIGFALPINEIKNTIDNVKENGRIIRPWLGVRYVMMNETIAKDNNLNVDYGALIVRGEQRTDLAVIPGSPADKAGLEENDIILELNGQKINDQNPLAKAISQFKPGDEITLKVLHDGDEKEIRVKLEEMK